MWRRAMASKLLGGALLEALNMLQDTNSEGVKEARVRAHGLLMFLRPVLTRSAGRRLNCGATSRASLFCRRRRTCSGTG